MAFLLQQPKWIKTENDTMNGARCITSSKVQGRLLKQERDNTMPSGPLWILEVT